MASAPPIEVGDYSKLVFITSDEEVGKRPVVVGKEAMVVIIDSTLLASLLLQTAKLAEEVMGNSEKV
ncbi:MAG: hypothetical protein COT89_02895 [Candidatus Colwellbacteria bacterium CG10_big_fil_rev_8_21_14_0_10_42_22]|uniref:Uncharacterized protein n=1 Tax=Candidatus Colwellbacteria bacterium CG10_big_fil_rev_8_21_14_0_10_42_22 TaxID=1974540 RepID=A0A2H0VFG9_9BACT|nr:MAG: hypothetical protein COT89_02895 [Candidatus Colwellbacteria bacterium CG10_big_fil_rev_8_21_14_0_10_42_22]